MNGRKLSQFNMTCQQYGDFFAGYDWSIFGCGTFKRRVSAAEAPHVMKRYVRELGANVKAWIPYVAAIERRTSGCGYPSIPLHLHFLAACPQQSTTAFLECARSLWSSTSGNSKINLYDPFGSAAHYIAKLAAHPNFEYMIGNLDRMNYKGPTDLVKAAEDNPYVPGHVKGRSHGKTLVLRDNISRLPVSTSGKEVS